MNVTSLSLAANESLILEYDNGSHWILLYDFKGPLENELGDPVIYETVNITELIIQHENETNSSNSSEFIKSTRTIKVIKSDTHFDLPLDLRIRFLAPGPQLHHVKLRGMVGFLYHCAWVVSTLPSALTTVPSSRGRQRECWCSQERGSCVFLAISLSFALRFECRSPPQLCTLSNARFWVFVERSRHISSTDGGL